jgi:hypothetical protein
LRAFWEIVGGVDFIWDYRGDEDAPDFGLPLDLAGLDPVAIVPAREVTYLFAEWADERTGVNPEIAGPFRVDLAPDYLHKANISGGPAYGIELPYLGADAPLVNEEHALPFVDYLRLCFRWGGFPRLERHAADARVYDFLRPMLVGIRPF